jgi:hypothetical protein
MPIEDINPVVQKLISKTQEKKIEWKIAYDATYLIEFRCTLKATEKKKVICTLEVDLNNTYSVLTIKYGPMADTLKFQNLIEVSARLEPVVKNLQYVLVDLYTKDALKYE